MDILLIRRHILLACMTGLAAVLSSTADGKVVCAPTISAIPHAMDARTGEKLGVSAAELAQFKRIVPAGKLLRLAVHLSDEKYALLYEADDVAAPDSHVLVVRDGQVVATFAMSSFAAKSTDERDWRKSFRGFQYGHICTDNEEALYLSLQSGNAGGFFVGIVESGQEATIVPFGDVAQGRIIISAQNPYLIELWDVAQEDRQLCTGCKKHYTVKTIYLGDNTMTVKKTRTTKQTYDGDEFQNHPLKFDDLFE